MAGYTSTYARTTLEKRALELAEEVGGCMAPPISELTDTDLINLNSGFRARRDSGDPRRIGRCGRRRE
jgi:hypothetical protein